MMKIKVDEEKTFRMITHVTSGTYGQEKFTIGTAGLKPYVLYRGRYASFDMSPNDFVQECLQAIDDQIAQEESEAGDEV